MFAGFGSFPFPSHFDDFNDFNDFGTTFPSRHQRRALTFKYYDALGVPRDATAAQIRRAFQKLARRLHPDKGGDSEKFKEVNEAYEVLKDEDKRRRYDLVGDEGFEEGGDCERPGTHTDDFFSDFMDMCGGMGPSASRTRRPQQQKSKDVSHTICASLEEFYNGATRHVSFERKRSCVSCKGTGFKDAVRHRCQHCHGRGVIVTVMRYGPGVVQEVQTGCDACGGTGLDSNPMHYCPTCCGSGENTEDRTLEVYIEQGMHNGHSIKYPGEASCSNPLLQPGDVIIKVQCEEHPEFTRKNVDLLRTVHIGLMESLCGVDCTIRHLDGRDVRLQSRPGELIKPGQVKCVENEGMPVHGQPQTKGNLYILFQVDYPDHISPRQQAAISSILGDNSTASRQRPRGADQVEIRDVPDLQEELRARERFGQTTGAAYDSDDSDDLHDGTPHVRCAQQ